MSLGKNTKTIVGGVVIFGAAVANFLVFWKESEKNRQDSSIKSINFSNILNDIDNKNAESVLKLRKEFEERREEIIRRLDEEERREEKRREEKRMEEQRREARQKS